MPDPAINRSPAPRQRAMTETSSVVRVPIAGLLGWLLPGAGHLFIGDLRRGLIIMATIAVTFWGGVAIGGVASTVDTKERKAWFMAQICAGGHGLLAYACSDKGATSNKPPAHWLSLEVGVIYSGVAGLLNLLVILDAMARADAGVPVVTPAAAGRAPPRRT